MAWPALLCQRNLIRHRIAPGIPGEFHILSQQRRHLCLQISHGLAFRYFPGHFLGLCPSLCAGYMAKIEERHDAATAGSDNHGEHNGRQLKQPNIVGQSERGVRYDLQHLFHAELTLPPHGG